MKGRVAWCTSPLLNGVTTAYRVVGRGLREAGWQVLGVTDGRVPPSALYPGFERDSLEILLTSILKEGCSTEIMVCRKKA